MTRIPSLHVVRPTSGQKLAMRTMLRSLLGEIDFDRLCPGMKVGTIDEDVLQVFVPAENCAACIKFRHSDDFAIAAEYALGQPIRKVNVLSADQSSISGTLTMKYAGAVNSRNVAMGHNALKESPFATANRGIGGATWQI